MEERCDHGTVLTEKEEHWFGGCDLCAQEAEDDYNQEVRVLIESQTLN